MRTLVCEFQPCDTEGFHNNGTRGKNYDYLYTGNREIKVGDWAVVHNGTNFGITKIQRIKPGISDKVMKHIITIVTQEDFQQYLEANKQINNHREVFDQLDYMLEQNKKMDRYKELAEHNSEAAELLKKAGVWQGPVIECQYVGPQFTEESSTVSETLKPDVTKPVDRGL